MKTGKESRATLKRRIKDLEAQLASRAARASYDVEKAGECLMGSAAILQITAPGGRVIVEPVAIRDGISAETIKCLQDDLRRSYALATLEKPKAAE